MKNLLPTLVLFSTVCVLARAYEPTAQANAIIPSSEIAELRGRVTELEKVIARTGDNGENVELRAPSFHGSIAIVDGDGNKIIEVQRREGIPGDFSALGFFGHIPTGQETLQGDWNGGSPDEANQCLMMGTLLDVVGDNIGFGLVKDRRLNY